MTQQLVAPEHPDRCTAQTAALPENITFEQYLDWLDEDTHAEWVKGRVIMHSPVSRRHSIVHKFVLRLVSEFVERTDLGEIAFDPFQMKIDAVKSSRAPDLLFVAKENLHRFTPNFLDGPADLVAEIISPSTRGIDRGDKYFEYEQGGVREYWLIDPDRKLAEFYVLGTDGRYATTRIADDGIFRSAVLEGFWMRVDWLWQETPPNLMAVLEEWGL